MVMGIVLDTTIGSLSFSLLCMSVVIDGQWTRNECTNFANEMPVGIIRTSVSEVTGIERNIALVTMMQRCFEVSNSKPGPRAMYDEL